MSCQMQGYSKNLIYIMVFEANLKLHTHSNESTVKFDSKMTYIHMDMSYLYNSIANSNTLKAIFCNQTDWQT